MTQIIRKLEPIIDWTLEVLWVRNDFSKKDVAIKYLKQEAENNNGDAYYILSRCLCGPEFVDPRFEFNENYELACEYLKKSILLGSPLGVLGGMRLAGFVPPDNTLVHPPFSSVQEAWHVVDSYAQNGSNFCKYLIANTVAWRDYIEIFNLDLQDKKDKKILYKAQKKAYRYYQDVYKKGADRCKANMEALNYQMSEENHNKEINMLKGFLILNVILFIIFQIFKLSHLALIINVPFIIGAAVSIGVKKANIP